MPTDSLVSVIIPTYNRPDFLRRAIASVRAQEGINYEIIIVDDASDEDLSSEFASAPDVTYLRNKKNRGGSFSRNRGLEVAKGEYVNFLDDDDEFLPGKLHLQLQKFEESELKDLGLVTCHMADGRSGEEVIIKNTDRGSLYRESLKRYTAKGTPTMLFKTEAVRTIAGFDSSLPANQEYDLIIRFSKHYTIDFVDEVLAKANRSVNQISMNFDKKIDGARMLFEKHDQAFREQGTAFRLRMKLKLMVLLFRFRVGKAFGEKAYRALLRS